MNDPADDLLASWRSFFAGSDPDTGLPFEIEDEMADQAFAAMQAALTGSGMPAEPGMPPMGYPGAPGAFAAMAQGPHPADIRELAVVPTSVVYSREAGGSLPMAVCGRAKL
jgi:hypothetical protein